MLYWAAGCHYPDLSLEKYEKQRMIGTVAGVGESVLVGVNMGRVERVRACMTVDTSAGCGIISVPVPLDCLDKPLTSKTAYPVLRTRCSSPRPHSDHVWLVAAFGYK